jgi:transglutaminase superfamily protein
MRERFSVPTLRGAWWAYRALRRARRDLRRDGLDGFTLLAPPPLPIAAERGVRAILRRRSRTCLETALVLQGWRTAQGDAREVVVGVSTATSSFKAHAWLDGDQDPLAASFHELFRVPSKGPIWNAAR